MGCCAVRIVASACIALACGAGAAGAAVPTATTYPLAGVDRPNAYAPQPEGRIGTRTFMRPVDLSLGLDGALLIADGTGVIRHLGLGGRITDLAGRNPKRARPSDTPALRLELAGPLSLAALPDGGFLVWDAIGRGHVRRVSPGGDVDTLARLRANDLLALPDGGFLASDTGGAVVRRVSASGVVSRFAGTGRYRGKGDGALATEAALVEPEELALLADGSVLIGHEDRIRRVDAAGRISTVARFGGLLDLEALPDGSFVVATFRGMFRGTVDGQVRMFARWRRDFAGRKVVPSRLVVLRDGSLAVSDGLMIWSATVVGPPQRLGVAIRDMASSSRSLEATVEATAAGVAVLEVSGPTGVLESSEMPVAVGLNRLSLPRAYAPGWHRVQVRVTDAAARSASDEVSALLGGRLRVRDARLLVAGQLDADGGGGNYVRRCHRFSRRRVDCEVRLGLLGGYDACDWISRVILPRTGIPRKRVYRCPKQGEPTFRRDVSHGTRTTMPMPGDHRRGELNGLVVRHSSGYRRIASSAARKNGLIAVHTERGDREQMWVIRPNGTGLVRFPRYGEGTFSPRGNRLAFSSGRRLTVTNVNGRKLARIPTSRRGNSLYVNEPTWASDGRIYFDTIGDGHFSVPVQGGRPRRLGRGGMSLDVSSTGRVAYERDADFSGDSVIFTSEADGSDERRLGRGFSPSWSPDGRQIAFDRNGIMISNADGSQAERLRGVPRHGVLYLTWSPDGKKIAFIGFRSAASEREAVFVADIEAGTVREILRDRRIQTDSMSSIQWQPLPRGAKIKLPRTQPVAGKCKLLGSRTIRRTESARIFTENGRYYACLFEVGKIVELRGGDIGPVLDRVALKDQLIAYEIESEGSVEGQLSDLYVRDLASGRLIRSTYAVDQRISGQYSDVRDLVVASSGAIAWTVQPYDARLRSLAPEVYKYDADGADRLDIGTTIGLKSLAISGDEISWRHGEDRRTAVLR